jgi:hypothetical protein
MGNFMIRWSRILLLPCLLALTSCMAMMDKDFHTVVAPSSTSINGELASLNVVEAPPEERTGLMVNRLSVSDYIIKQWYIGLDDAIIQSGVFTGHRQLTLSVSVRRMSLPLLGLGATGTVEADYKITDQASGATIYDKPIVAEGYVPFGYSPIGVIRGNEAVDRSVQNNIKAFIADLETSLAAKPTAVAPAPTPHV